MRWVGASAFQFLNLNSEDISGLGPRARRYWPPQHTPYPAFPASIPPSPAASPLLPRCCPYLPLGGLRWPPTYSPPSSRSSPPCPPPPAHCVEVHLHVVQQLAPQVHVAHPLQLAGRLDRLDGLGVHQRVHHQGVLLRGEGGQYGKQKQGLTCAGFLCGVRPVGHVMRQTLLQTQRKFPHLHVLRPALTRRRPPCGPLV